MGFLDYTLALSGSDVLRVFFSMTITLVSLDRGMWEVSSFLSRHFRKHGNVCLHIDNSVGRVRGRAVAGLGWLGHCVGLEKSREMILNSLSTRRLSLKLG